MDQHAPSVTVRLCDEFELAVGDRDVDVSGPAQRVIAALAVHDTPVTRCRIVADLWPDLARAEGLTRLRDAVYRIRQATPPLLRSTGHRLSIAPGVDVDVLQVLRQAREIVNSNVPEFRVSVSDLAPRQVLSSWDEPWLTPLRQDLSQTCVRALEYLAHDRIDQARFHDAEMACRLVIDAEPYRESAHALLAQVFIAEGNPALALRTVQDFEHRMMQELGLSPGRAVQYVERSIRESAHALSVG
ncbi:MAG: BTAD domain-containing putative transcriptional regulator [Pedococcus sp.]